jgi:hypothetical protein
LFSGQVIYYFLTKGGYFFQPHPGLKSPIISRFWCMMVTLPEASIRFIGSVSILTSPPGEVRKKLCGIDGFKSWFSDPSFQACMDIWNTNKNESLLKEPYF